LNSFTKYNGPGNGNVRDENRFNDWGGSAGGPILKNRLFVFFSYEDLANKAKQKSGAVGMKHQNSARWPRQHQMPRNTLPF